MPKARITTASGTQIIIEGDNKDILEIINLVQGQSQKKTGPTTHKKREGKENKSKSLTATEFIPKLKEDGFFDKPKGMGQVKERLDTEGLIYPLTTLSGVLLDQVRKKELRRLKINKKWHYVKR